MKALAFVYDNNEARDDLARLGRSEDIAEEDGRLSLAIAASANVTQRGDNDKTENVLLLLNVLRERLGRVGA